MRPPLYPAFPGCIPCRHYTRHAAPVQPTGFWRLARDSGQAITNKHFNQPPIRDAIFSTGGTMLYIAEKPELARAIVEALGGGGKQNGYYECGRDKVTWCFGHMLRLCEPEEYGASPKESSDSLPLSMSSRVRGGCWERWCRIDYMALLNIAAIREKCFNNASWECVIKISQINPDSIVNHKGCRYKLQR